MTCTASTGNYGGSMDFSQVSNCKLIELIGYATVLERDSYRQLLFPISFEILNPM